MRTQLGLALVILLGSAFTPIARAQAPDEDSARFEAAFALEGKGQLAEAARSLEAFAAERPAHALAPDALREAASLYDDQLFDPASALRCWTRLATAYPQSASAARARTRMEALGTALDGSSASDLGALERLIAVGGVSPTPAQREVVARFVSEHPEQTLVARAHYWLGHVADLAGDEPEALRRYDQAIRSSGAWAARAARGKAELLLRHRRYAAARSAYLELSRYPDPVSRLAHDAGLRALATAQRLRLWAIAAWITLLLFFGSHLALGRGAFWPVPLEVRFLAPVAALFVIAAVTEHRSIGVAVTCIAVGGLLVSWASASAHQARCATSGALALPLRLLLIGAAASAVLSLSFLAVRENELLELVGETLKMGPER